MPKIGDPAPLGDLATLIEDLRDGLVLTGADGRALYANRAARAALGGTARGVNAALRGESGPLPERLDLEGLSLAVQWSEHAGGARLGLLRDVSDDLAERERREAEARLDPLTGLPNRATLSEALEHALAECGDLGADVGLLAIDLDEFKPVNDTLGHAVGDALLAGVAKRLLSAVREDDGVFRMGGDEFVVLVPCSAAGSGDAVAVTDAIARRIVDLVARAFLIDGQMINIGASIGVAVSEGTRDPVALLKRADVALYRAKHEGRGRHVHYAPGMDDAMRERRELEIEIRRGIALQQFELVYQPQFELETAKVTGFEALVRWRHPTKGQLGPGDFIVRAEESGLIVPLGEWIMRSACETAARWTEPVSVSVNVSPVQFAGGGLLATVRDALARSGLDPRRLVVEITESLLLRNDPDTLETLRELRAMGIRIAMDDFGTGTSSLSYLRTFPFDIVKVDQSFVRGDGDRERLGAIVRAVTSLGDQMGMKITAEGVETMEQFEAVLRDGCGTAQGFLIGRPMPEGDVASFFEEAGDICAAEVEPVAPIGVAPSPAGGPVVASEPEPEPAVMAKAEQTVESRPVVQPAPEAVAAEAPAGDGARGSGPASAPAPAATPAPASKKRAPGKPSTPRRKRRAVDAPPLDAPKPSGAPLYRLVYQSLCALHDTEASLQAEVEDILRVARDNNARLGVSGALMFNGVHYAQVLEGPRDVVERLFETIQLDSRHAEVTLLSFEPTDARLFDRWSMAHVSASGGRMAELAALTGFDREALSGDEMAARLHDILVKDAPVPA